MPHQDEGMEWEEEIRYLFNNGGTNPSYAKSHIQYSDSKYPNQLTEELVIKTIKSLLAKDRIDTARKIARAAGQAGLSPRDLAKAEDWIEAVAKDRQQLRKRILNLKELMDEKPVRVGRSTSIHLFWAERNEVRATIRIAIRAILEGKGTGKPE